MIWRVFLRFFIPATFLTFYISNVFYFDNVFYVCKIQISSKISRGTFETTETNKKIDFIGQWLCAEQRCSHYVGLQSSRVC